MSSVADPHQFDADSDRDPTFQFDAVQVPDPDPSCPFDADPDPTFPFDPSPDPDPIFQIKAQNLEKVLKKAHFPHFCLVICKLMRIRVRILPFNLMRIHADPDPQHCL